jgi:hypothetical protein
MFEGVQKLFKKPDPKELVRKWQADLRTEQRKIDRQIRGAAQCCHPAGPAMQSTQLTVSLHDHMQTSSLRRRRCTRASKKQPSAMTYRPAG